MGQEQSSSNLDNYIKTVNAVSYDKYEFLRKSKLPARNSRCKSGGFVDCVKERTEQQSNKIKLLNWRNSVQVGKGSFGVVTKWTVDYEVPNNNKKSLKRESLSLKPELKTINVAVKEVNIKCTVDEKNNKLNNMGLEVEFNYYMAENGLGPTLYDAFYTMDESLLGGIHIIQYFIMENMDMDCQKYLTSKQFNSDDKENVVYQIVGILNKQIFKLGLLCSDIKPWFANC
jgi:hypothetical protein